MMHRGIVTKFARCLANLVLTEKKAHKELDRLIAAALIEMTLQHHGDHQSLQKVCVCVSVSFVSSLMIGVRVGLPRLDRF